MPFFVAFTNAWCHASLGEQLSASPKLIEMMSPRLLFTASLKALSSASSELFFPISSTMFAPGAIAWAHSTSSEISSAQPGSYPSEPSGATTEKLGVPGPALTGGRL